MFWVFFFFFFFGHKACGILDPQPGMEPPSPALEGEVLTMDHQVSPSNEVLTFSAMVLVFIMRLYSFLN